MNPPKNRENSITRYYIAEENLAGSVKERKAEDSGTDLLKLLNVLYVHGDGGAG